MQSWKYVYDGGVMASELLDGDILLLLVVKWLLFLLIKIQKMMSTELMVGWTVIMADCS